MALGLDAGGVRVREHALSFLVAAGRVINDAVSGADLKTLADVACLYADGEEVDWIQMLCSKSNRTLCSLYSATMFSLSNAHKQRWKHSTSCTGHIWSQPPFTPRHVGWCAVGLREEGIPDADEGGYLPMPPF